MNAVGFSPEKLPSREVCADAAAWLTGLQDPERTSDVEEGFRLWLAEHPDHATGFQMALETWERAARLYRRPTERVAACSRRAGFHLSVARAAATLTAVAVTAVLATVFYLRSGAVSTGVGEQRSLTLEDGSRMVLNTNTRLTVHYDQHTRRVDLKNGEAFFEVAPGAPGRPFVVTTGERTITALGTAFVVRRDARLVAVTLVEGKVVVTAGSAGETAKKGKTHAPALKQSVVLAPGERWIVADHAPARVDRPAIDKVMAWQQGQLAFDNTPLPEAVQELNRYSATQLVVERPEAQRIRVSGVFRAGDNASFARAMAATYRLQWKESSGEIVLSGSPIMPQQ